MFAQPQTATKCIAPTHKAPLCDRASLRLGGKRMHKRALVNLVCARGDSYHAPHKSILLTTNDFPFCHASNYFLLLRMQLVLCQATWKKVLRTTIAQWTSPSPQSTLLLPSHETGCGHLRSPTRTSAGGNLELALGWRQGPTMQTGRGMSLCTPQAPFCSLG